MLRLQKINILLIVTIAVLTESAKGDAVSNLEEAFNNLTQEEQKAFHDLDHKFFDNLKVVIKCIEDKSNSTINSCNYAGSYDSIYYLEECLKGTSLQKSIEKLLKSKKKKDSVGIPIEVIKDRCFDPASNPKKQRSNLVF